MKPSRFGMGGVLAPAFAAALALFPALAAEPERDPCAALAGKRIRLIVPFAPGGGYDICARLLAPFAEKQLGATVRVENLTGAGGMLATRVLHRAKPDGQTLGLINGSGLLTATLRDDIELLHPVRDFTVVGRVSSTSYVLAAARDAGWRNLDDLLDAAREKPVVFGTSWIGGNSFVGIVATAHTFDFRYRLVLGYTGSQLTLQALARGDVDACVHSENSLLPWLRGGELRALMHLGDRPSSLDPLFAAVPCLGGKEGLAVQWARERGQDPKKAERHARMIYRLTTNHRVLVAPPGMDPELAACLRRRLLNAMRDAGFLAAMRKACRNPDVADAGKTSAELAGIESAVKEFGPLLKKAMQKAGVPGAP